MVSVHVCITALDGSGGYGATPLQDLEWSLFCEHVCVCVCVCVCVRVCVCVCPCVLCMFGLV